MKPTKLAREMQCIPEGLHGLFTAARQMNTLVCEVCYAEELNEHPALGTQWGFEWSLAIAKLADERGWVTRDPPPDRERRFFEHFQVVGPDCHSRSSGGSNSS